MKKIVEHFTMLIIAGLLGGIMYLLLVNNEQQEQFMMDANFYKNKLNSIENKIDSQTVNIQKTIEDQFNKGFDCNITNE